MRIVIGMRTSVGPVGGVVLEYEAHLVKVALIILLWDGRGAWRMWWRRPAAASSSPPGMLAPTPGDSRQAAWKIPSRRPRAQFNRSASAVPGRAAAAVR